MKRAGYESARSLGLDLGMSDGSQVTKWLNGTTKRVMLERHLRHLPELLSTPKDYFRDNRTTADRLGELEETAARAEDLQRLERVLTEAIEFLANGDAPAALRVLSELEGVPAR